MVFIGSKLRTTVLLIKKYIYPKGFKYYTTSYVLTYFIVFLVSEVEKKPKSVLFIGQPSRTNALG